MTSISNPQFLDSLQSTMQLLISEHNFANDDFDLQQCVTKKLRYQMQISHNLYQKQTSFNQPLITLFLIIYCPPLICMANNLI